MAAKDHSKEASDKAAADKAAADKAAKDAATSAASATTGTDLSKETNLGTAGDVAAGAVQLTEDSEGTAFVRTVEAGGLRTENMPTQAQVQVAQAVVPVGAYKKDEGIESVSVDGQSVSRVWPMVAVTHVSVANATYGPGQPFSVGDKESRDTLIDQGAAVDRVLKASQDPRPGDPSRFAGVNHEASV